MKDEGHLRATDHPAWLAVAAAACLLVIASAIAASVCPLESLRHGYHRVFTLALLIPLLQIGIGFVAEGHDAASEVRFRMSLFCVTAVLLVYISSFAIFSWRTVAVNDLWPRINSIMGAHWVRWVFLWSIFPLLAGFLVHSALYALHETRRLRATERNVIAACLVAVVLGLGTSVAGTTMALSFRIQSRETRDLRDGFTRLWNETDRLTQEYVDENPTDYEFLLLRAGFLEEAGRTEESRVLYRRACGTADLPSAIRSWIDAKAEE